MADESGDTDRGIERISSTVRTRSKDGTLALAGGMLALVVAARAAGRRRLRAGVSALAGFGLLRYGLWQRRSAGDGEQASTGRDSVESTVTSQRSGVQRDQLVDATAGATHRSESTESGRADDGVPIDISSPSTADEPGEAVGPDPTDAQPTQTESTEPEADPDADVGGDHVDDRDGGDGAAAGTDADETDDSDDPDTIDDSDVATDDPDDAGDTDDSDAADDDATRSGAGPNDPDGPGGSPTGGD